MTIGRDEWRDLDKDVSRGIRYGTKWLIAVVAVIAVIAIAWAVWVGPALEEGEENRRRESTSYVETQVAFMQQKLSAIRVLEADIEATDDARIKTSKQAQINAFTIEIRERADRIDPEEVPPSVQNYLEEVKSP